MPSIWTVQVKEVGPVGQPDLVGAAGRADPQPRAPALLGVDEQPLHVGGADLPVAGGGGLAVLAAAAGGQQHGQDEGEEAWSHLPCVGSGVQALKALGASTVVAGRFTVHFHAGDGAATSGGCALRGTKCLWKAGVR